MKESIQKYYGVNLDDSYNRAITDAWDNAQEKVLRLVIRKYSLRPIYFHNNDNEIRMKILLHFILAVLLCGRRSELGNL